MDLDVIAPESNVVRFRLGNIAEADPKPELLRVKPERFRHHPNRQHREEPLHLCLWHREPSVDTLSPPNLSGVQLRAPEGGAQRRRMATGSCNALFGSASFI